MIHTHAADHVAVGEAIDPDATSASTVTSGWMDAGEFHGILAVVMVGTLGTSATVDAKLEQATSAAGAGAKDVTGSDITQLTDGDSDDDKQALISLQTSSLDVDNDFRFVRLSITVGTATSDVGGLLLGVHPRSAPADDFDASTVDEVVRV